MSRAVEVVAVPLDVAREAAVVQPEQAHHPVGDGTHGHERAHRQVTGAEVGPASAGPSGGRPGSTACRHSSASTALTSVFGVASSTSSSSSAVSWARCQASRAVVAVRESEIAASVPAQASTGRSRRARRARLGAGRGTRPGGPPDRCRRCRRRRTGASPRRDAGAPRPSPPRAGSGRARLAMCWLSMSAELERAAVLGVEAPADERAVHPLLQPEEVVVAEMEPAADRLAARQVEDLGRGDPAPWRARAPPPGRPSPGWSGGATGRPAGSRACASGSSDPRSRRAPPNVAWMSGAKFSMSGHITMMSRGSRVGSSSSRCRTASRSTSTWRPRPWHECTRMLSSSGVEQRPRRPRPPPLPAGARSARTSSWIRRRSVGTCRSPVSGLVLAVRDAPRRARAASRGRRAPRTPAAGCAARPPSGPRAADKNRDDGPTVGLRAGPTARATGATGRGGRPGLRRRPRARRGSWRAAGSARTGTAAAGSPGAPGSSRSRLAGLDQALRRARQPDPLAQQPPQLDLPVRLVLLRRPCGPALEHVGAVHGVAVEEVRHVPDAREALRALARSRSCGCAGPAAPATARRSAPRPPRCSGHTARSGNHGSASGSSRCQRQRAGDQRPGKGKSMLAHTPSCAAGRLLRGAPTGAASASARCRASGTETTSGVIGSSSGSATRSASIATKASARSERWTCSTPAEYVGAVLGAGGARPRLQRPERLLASGRGAGAGAALGQRQDDRLPASSSSSSGSTACRWRGAVSIGETPRCSPDSSPTTPRPGNLRAETSTRDSKEPTALL